MKNIMKLALIIFLSITITGCSDKNIDISKIQTNLENDYPSFDKLDKESLEGSYGIDTSKFENYIVVIDKTSNKGSMYAVFKAKKNDSESAEYEAEYFIDRYKDSWSLGYFPEETKLVNEGVKEIYGEYIIFVVNKDPDKIISKIKNSK